MFKPGFTSDNVSWVSPYTRAPSNVVLWCSTSLQIKKRIVIDMYLFLSLKEVQGNASWNEQKKSGDAYRQSDKRIEFIVISALLYPGQVHKCTGVCTKDTAKNKWIPSIIVKCQNALHQNALRSLDYFVSLKLYRVKIVAIVLGDNCELLELVLHGHC